MFQVLPEHIVLLKGHLFKADGAHVVIVTMIDVCFVRILNAILERLPSCLGSELCCQIL